MGPDGDPPDSPLRLIHSDPRMQAASSVTCEGPAAPPGPTDIPSSSKPGPTLVLGWFAIAVR
jgi:hypothetical protein